MVTIKQTLRKKRCREKKAYASEETANLASQSAPYLNPYKCDICGAWHLTSYNHKQSHKNRKVKMDYGKRGALGNRKKLKRYWKRLRDDI